MNTSYEIWDDKDIREFNLLNTIRNFLKLDWWELSLSEKAKVNNARARAGLPLVSYRNIREGLVEEF